MNSLSRRLLCAALCLLILLPAFCSCGTESDAETGFESLTIRKDRTVSAVVALDPIAVRNHTGQTASFYELLPGETVADLPGKTPLDTSKVTTRMRFRFSLTEGEHTRLYSSYAVGFSDGSVLFSDGRYPDNPSVTATKSGFLWAKTPKGLVVSDVEQAIGLNCLHAAVPMSLSLLFAGSGLSFRFDGEDFSVNDSAIASLDRSISAASAAGMQVTLSLTPDILPSPRVCAALFDFLAARYTDGDRGTVSAVVLGASETCSATDAARLSRLAWLAFSSRFADTRVYVTCGAKRLDDTVNFFESIRTAQEKGGDFDWRAAVSPASDSSAVWDENDPGRVSFSNLKKLSEALTDLRSDAKRGFAVVNLCISAQNPEQQAASCAFAWRAALDANAELFLYGAQKDDVSGLFTSDGTERPVTSVFSAMETDSAAVEELCSRLIGDPWNELRQLSVLRIDVSGAVSVGNSGFSEEPLFDFTGGELFGFAAAGNAEAPESHISDAWNQPVLYTWVTRENGGGIRRLSADATFLQNARSLSVQLLPQLPGGESCTVRLRITGIARNGRLLFYNSDITVTGGIWRTLTFQTDAFGDAVDPDSPCVLSITVEPEKQNGDPFVLWVRNISARRMKNDFSGLLLAVLVTVGITGSFLLCLLIYRAAGRKKRRRHPGQCRTPDRNS